MGQICATCHGSKMIGGKNCPTCGGKGWIEGVGTKKCPACGGQGSKTQTIGPAVPCTRCGGSGFITY